MNRLLTWLANKAARFLSEQDLRARERRIQALEYRSQRAAKVVNKASRKARQAGLLD